MIPPAGMSEYGFMVDGGEQAVWVGTTTYRSTSSPLDQSIALCRPEHNGTGRRGDLYTLYRKSARDTVEIKYRSSRLSGRPPPIVCVSVVLSHKSSVLREEGKCVMLNDQC